MWKGRKKKPKSIMMAKIFAIEQFYRDFKNAEN